MDRSIQPFSATMIIGSLQNFVRIYELCQTISKILEHRHFHIFFSKGACWIPLIQYEIFLYDNLCIRIKKDNILLTCQPKKSWILAWTYIGCILKIIIFFPYVLGLKNNLLSFFTVLDLSTADSFHSIRSQEIFSRPVVYFFIYLWIIKSMYEFIKDMIIHDKFWC